MGIIDCIRDNDDGLEQLKICENDLYEMLEIEYKKGFEEGILWEESDQEKIAGKTREEGYNDGYRKAINDVKGIMKKFYSSH